MNLHVSNLRTVAEVKADFNRFFPYLRLEFTKNNGQSSNGNTTKERIPDDLIIGSIRVKKNEGEIEFSENSTVQEFESLFFDKFGLNVQVYRRSGNIWLETTMTDNWTLRMQNEHGREITEI